MGEEICVNFGQEKHENKNKLKKTLVLRQNIDFERSVGNVSPT